MKLCSGGGWGMHLEIVCDYEVRDEAVQHARDKPFEVIL